MAYLCRNLIGVVLSELASHQCGKGSILDSISAFGWLWFFSILHGEAFLRPGTQVYHPAPHLHPPCDLIHGLHNSCYYSLHWFRFINEANGLFYCIDPLSSSVYSCDQRTFACRLNCNNSYHATTAHNSPHIWCQQWNIPWTAFHFQSKFLSYQ